jgi:hypothetical protein
MKKIALSALVSANLLLGGCASIVGDNDQLVPISSTPRGATIRVADEKGANVFRGVTPNTVLLKKSDGNYFGKKTYTVKIEEEGYLTQTVPINSGPNALYIGGNFVFGGLLGWLAFDPMNGGMYTLAPEQALAGTGIQYTHNNQGEDRSISVVLAVDPNAPARRTTSAQQAATNALGRFGYEAERLAKNAGCIGENGVRPLGSLVHQGQSFEVYAVACTTGTMNVRCENNMCELMR